MGPPGKHEGSDMRCQVPASAIRRWAVGAAMSLGLAAPALSALPLDPGARPVAVSAARAPASALLPAPEQAAGGEANEQGLRQALQTATWPGDMVRLADEYLQQFAHRPWAADAVDIRRRAAVTAHLLRGDDVQLFRADFALPRAAGTARDELRRAALGDASAAFRLARQSPSADAWQVGWLQLASELGNERAAYELALHFRRRSQPLMASQYEQRALELGYAALPSLDHARK